MSPNSSPRKPSPGKYLGDLLAQKLLRLAVGDRDGTLVGFHLDRERAVEIAAGACFARSRAPLRVATFVSDFAIQGSIAKDLHARSLKRRG